VSDFPCSAVRRTEFFLKSLSGAANVSAGTLLKESRLVRPDRGFPSQPERELPSAQAGAQRR
jgi:hypothetical protein